MLDFSPLVELLVAARAKMNTTSPSCIEGIFSAFMVYLVPSQQVMQQAGEASAHGIPVLLAIALHDITPFPAVLLILEVSPPWQ